MWAGTSEFGWTFQTAQELLHCAPTQKGPTCPRALGRKWWEQCAEKLATDAEGVAAFDGTPLVVGGGPCVAEGVPSAPIS